MVETQIQRERKAVLSAWLCDRFGEEFDIEPFFWRDAEDLIKFLKANGLEIQFCQEAGNVPQAARAELTPVDRTNRDANAKFTKELFHIT